MDLELTGPMAREDVELDKRLGGKVPMTYDAHALIANERLYCVYSGICLPPPNAEPVIVVRKGNTE